MAYASWSVVFGEQPSAAKWNILGTNDASFNDGTGIASDAIHPNHLTTGLSSTTWAWQTWTPTLVNLSGGTQTYAKYIQVGKTVICRFLYTLAGAGVAGDVSFSPPVTAASDYTGLDVLGSGIAVDANTTTDNNAGVFFNTTTSFLFRYWSNTNLVTALSTTAPFTWASGDEIQCQFMYEAA